ncbi:MAG: hypothetical protein ABGZ17_26805 [Planctomycetaceae bacterium]
MIDQLSTAAGCCRFAIGSCEITPSVGTYHRMWGAAAHDRSTGIHRPLEASVVVLADADLSDSEPPLILVTLDHCLLREPDMRALHALVSTRCGISGDQLLVTFSHTHAAGLMETNRDDLPGGDRIGPYLDQMGLRVAELVAQVLTALQPAVITCGLGHCGLAGHRDLYDETSQQWVCGFNPEGPVDDDVLVARVTDGSGQPLAVLVNYACHPTTLAWDNTLVSTDFPGAMREVVQQHVGAPCVFLQGASGDVGPRNGFVGDVTVADANGRQLGFAVLAALEALPPPRTQFHYVGPVVSGATIGVWEYRNWDAEQTRAASRFRIRQWTVDLPYRAGLPTVDTIQAQRAEWEMSERQALDKNDQQAAQHCRAMIERQDRSLIKLRDLPSGPAFPFPVTVCQLGNLVWVLVEGEPYQLLQRRLRQRFPAMNILVVTLVNGSRCSYLPTQEVYDTGIYQESIAVLAPGCLESLMGSIAGCLTDWTVHSGG